MNKEEVIKQLDWYFDHLNNYGLMECAAKTAYRKLKEYLEQVEKNIDKIYKINIYLMRKYKDNLIKEFGSENNFIQWLKIFEDIVKQMNEEMPEPWYTYGIGGKENV